MADFFLRQDLADGELAAVRDAAGLLAWARAETARARPADVVRDREGRRTLRLRRHGRVFFLKLHTGVGWGEIAKNLLQLRLPVVSAANEYRAVAALHRCGVATLEVAAYARQGRNPASRCSLLLSDELAGCISLEDYCADWAAHPPPAALRMRLLITLAHAARRMHAAGINHRDFYLCHFHLDPDSVHRGAPRCYLIDLHRAQLRRRTPRRWRAKDLGGLYFSAMGLGLRRRDLLRFMHHYSPGGLRRALGPDSGLWRRAERRARRLYTAAHGCAPPALDRGPG